MDGYTRSLYRDRSVLVQKIARHQNALARVSWSFQLSAFSIAIGLLVLWLALADVTLATIGETRYALDFQTFGVCGAILMSLGFLLLSLTAYIKVRYPARLASLSQSLKDLDDLLVHQKVFPEKFRETLGLPYHTYYEDHLKERQTAERQIRKLTTLQTFLRIHRIPICLIVTGLLVIIPALLQGLVCESITVGGLAILLGIVWGFLNRRKHGRARFR
jgi:hypothetical protein